MPQTKPPVRRQLSKCAYAKAVIKNTENEDEGSLDNKRELIYLMSSEAAKRTTVPWKLKGDGSQRHWN